MSKDNEKDASPNWNGYMYQGKVALLVTLEEINKIDDISEYWLELEGIEDFSIGNDDKYIYIYQVKNRKNTDLKDYREALSNLLQRIQEHPEINYGYLNSKEALTISEWDKDIYKVLSDYKPQKINILESMIETEDNLDKIYGEILGKWNDSRKKIDRTTSKVNKLIIDKLETEYEIQKKEDITKERLKNVIEKVLEEEKLQYKNCIREELIKKIYLYKYSNGQTSANSKKIMSMIDEQIKKYWGEQSEYKEEKIHIYCIKLLELINANITQRAEEDSREKRILLKEFINILNLSADKICPDTKEEILLRLKYLYVKKKEEFCTDEICEVKNEGNCEKCSLGEISKYILEYSLPEMETIFRSMSVHKTEELTTEGFQLVEGLELENTFFTGISEIERDFFINQYKILCRGNSNFMMATTIDAEKQGRKRKTIKGLIKNDISHICEQIINSDNCNAMVREIDKLITKNFDTENIFEEVHKINGIQGDLEYMNIMKPKKVGLISIEKAKELYGGRKCNN